MIIIGLTGSIGMGKSFVAKCFARLGAAVFDADREVHKLMEPEGEAYNRISRVFPESLEGNVISRAKLGGIVFNDRSRLHQLENILHPLVREKRKEFLRKCFRKRINLVVYDIPLLLETGAEKECDLVIVASAPEYIQKMRAIKRSGISEEKFRRINLLQMPTKEKEKRADFVIKTGLGRRSVINQVEDITSIISG